MPQSDDRLYFGPNEGQVGTSNPSTCDMVTTVAQIVVDSNYGSTITVQDTRDIACVASAYGNGGWGMASGTLNLGAADIVLDNDFLFYGTMNATSSLLGGDLSITTTTFISYPGSVVNLTGNLDIYGMNYQFGTYDIGDGTSQSILTVHGYNDIDVGGVTDVNQSSKLVVVGGTSMALSGTLNLYGATLDLSGISAATDLLMNGHLNSYGGGMGTGDTVLGAVVNGGVIEFFNGFHTLAITGSYEQSGSGSLQMRMGVNLLSNASDQVSVSGSVTLAGALDVAASGTLPSSGTWTIITGGSISGGFNPLLVTLPSGVSLSYGTYSVTLVK